MKTITNNEDYVRLRIYEGALKADEGVAEMLRLEREQHKATARRYQRLLEDERATVARLRAQLGGAQ